MSAAIRIACLGILLTACGGGEAPPAPPAPVTASPAAPAAPAPAAAVGPDGPESIVVPELAPISTDPAVIAAGETVWGARGCGGCHTFGSKLVGPDLVGLTQRQTLPWVARMILEPEQMTRLDPVAKKLFATHMVQMPKQGVTAEELPKLMAFIKSKGG